MSHDAAKLGHMAGQIAAFFRYLPEAEAAAAIAGHINQFWSPRMRAALVGQFDADPARLDPLVRQALDQVRVRRRGLDLNDR